MAKKDKAEETVEERPQEILAVTKLKANPPRRRHGQIGAASSGAHKNLKKLSRPIYPR